MATLSQLQAVPALRTQSSAVAHKAHCRGVLVFSCSLSTLSCLVFHSHLLSPVASDDNNPVSCDPLFHPLSLYSSIDYCMLAPIGSEQPISPLTLELFGHVCSCPRPSVLMQLATLISLGSAVNAMYICVVGPAALVLFGKHNMSPVSVGTTCTAVTFC